MHFFSIILLLDMFIFFLLICSLVISKVLRDWKRSLGATIAMKIASKGQEIRNIWINVQLSACIW
jgi:hypothetical protein